MNEPQKELMTIKEFTEIYGVKIAQYYAEVKKYPWLITKIGKKMVRIRRKDAEKWLDAIKQEKINLPS